MLTQLFADMQKHFRNVLHEPLHIRQLSVCDLCGETH